MIKKQKNIKNINNYRPKKKKQFGQHFLRKQSVVDHMIHKKKITPQTSVLEIGCGDGFLTKAILRQTNCKELRVYEIDPEWANLVAEKLDDPRLNINIENILDVDLSILEESKPWVLLANLPYQITFPIFYKIQAHKNIFDYGVVMIQEEVAQKIVAKSGKGYNLTSIFLQYHFDFELMEKVEPEAFNPPPKVFSRLIYFKPKFDLLKIKDEQEFWKFLKLCFMSPRRTITNNLRQTHYDLSKIPQNILKLRAQQMSFDDFIKLWDLL
jgi:16S rRNA (adenine1518-N6/adenine1519-N6)-dimethyltransferase